MKDADSIKDVTARHLSGSLPPIKILAKIAHRNCNIGAEGTLDVYLANLYDIEKDKNKDKVMAVAKKKVLLAIFIGLHEEIVFKTVRDAPAYDTEAHIILHDVLSKLSKLYLDISVAQRNQCALVN